MSKLWKGPALEEPCVEGNAISYVFKDSHRWKNLQALECGYTGKTLTYAELQEALGRWGAWLMRYRGDELQPPVVVKFAPTSLETIVVYLGTLAAGAVATSLGNSFGEREHATQLENYDATLMVATVEFLPRLKAALEKLGRPMPVVVIGDVECCDTKGLDVVGSYEAIMNDESLTPIDPVELSGEETSQLLYTSGTTGLSKSVEHTHNSMIGVVRSCAHPTFFPQIEPEFKQRRTLMVRDVGHSSGSMVGLLPGLVLGTCMVIKSFEESTFIEDIERFQINTAGIVPQHFSTLLQLGRERPDLQKTLRHVRVGGSAIATQHVQAVHKLLPKIFLQKMYGTSEVGLIAADPVGGGKEGSTGKLCAGVTAKVLDDEGKMLPANKKGILYIKTPGAMKGYLKNPDATRKVVDEDGWYNTEDLALVDDDGCVLIVERLKELMKVDCAYTISPVEIEHTILELEDVREVCVVGAPVGDTGMDVIYAFVVKKPNAASDVTEKGIQDYVTQQLNKKKQPKRVIFVEALSRNQMGKLNRKFFKCQAAQIQRKSEVSGLNSE